jgi:hypothetical protein
LGQGNDHHALCLGLERQRNGFRIICFEF